MSRPIFRDLRKCEVLQSLGKGAFRARDLLNQEEIRVQMTGKQRMNYIKILPGDCIYAKYSVGLQAHRLISDTDLKWQDNLAKEKQELDKWLEQQIDV